LGEGVLNLYLFLDCFALLETLFDCLVEYWVLGELEFVLRYDFLWDFLVSGASNDIETSEEVVFIIWDMPVSGWLGPTVDFELMLGGKTEVGDWEIAVSYGVSD
jgi:hypothetical protein